MTEAKYKVSLSNLKKYIKMLGLKVDYGLHYDNTSISKYSKDTIENLCRSSDLSYDELYKLIVENFDYDIFIPEDYGAFQFYVEKSNNRISKIVYCYYSNSRDFGELNDLLKYSESRSENGIVDFQFLRDFQCIIDCAPPKDNVIYFRYDYDPTIYNGIIHASSHMHIGWNNEIRLPIRYMLTPEMFVDFVVKNVYKELWHDALNKSKFKDRVLKLKSESIILDSNMFNDDEKRILHMF